MRTTTLFGFLLAASFAIVGCRSAPKQPAGTRMTVIHPYLEVRAAMQQMSTRIQSNAERRRRSELGGGGTNGYTAEYAIGYAIPAQPADHAAAIIAEIREHPNYSYELVIGEDIAPVVSQFTTIRATASRTNTTEIFVSSVSSAHLFSSTDWMSKARHPDKERQRLTELLLILERDSLIRTPR